MSDREKQTGQNSGENERGAKDRWIDRERWRTTITSRAYHGTTTRRRSTEVESIDSAPRLGATRTQERWRWLGVGACLAAAAYRWCACLGTNLYGPFPRKACPPLCGPILVPSLRPHGGPCLYKSKPRPITATITLCSSSLKGRAGDQRVIQIHARFLPPTAVTRNRSDD